MHIGHFIKTKGNLQQTVAVTSKGRTVKVILEQIVCGIIRTTQVIILYRNNSYNNFSKGVNSLPVTMHFTKKSTMNDWRIRQSRRDIKPFCLAEDMLSGHQKAITSNLVQRRHGLDTNSIVVVLRIATKNTEICLYLLANALTTMVGQ